jgi:hypothetical protein
MPDHAALITAQILDRPLCVDCAAEKSGLSVSAVAATLARVQTALQLRSAISRCRACGLVTAVFSVDRRSP